MKLIKLDAIDSTNEFLKGLSNNQVVKNFTVVSAESQTKGKGQMGSIWVSEPSKNIIMSVLVKDFVTEINQIFDINIVVAVSIINVLQGFAIPELSIKWPNDIMSDNKKIGGILIENSIKGSGSINSVVGLGLNVNQIDFEHLPKASSMASICKTTFDKEEILLKIVQEIKINIKSWSKKKELLRLAYTNSLFKKGIPMPFAKVNQQNFMGIVQGVSKIGMLQILLDDDTVSEFDIKEIQMLY